MEIWKNVDGFEGLYEVSNWGRVRSVARVVIRKNGWRQSVVSRLLRQNYRGRTGRIAELIQPYRSVYLHNFKVEFKGKLYPVHRLVAVAFLPNPNNYNQVNHIDSNPQNNHVSNLEWCDNRLNQLHSVFAGRRAHLMKRVAILNMAGEDLMYVSSIHTAAKITRANRTAVRHVCEGKNSHAKGFRFKMI